MISRLLQRADVKEFLHEVITDERFRDKTSPVTPENLSYPEAEYSLILIMDALLKYAILFETDDLVDEYVLQLRRFMKKCYNHRDLVEGINRLLGRITATVLKINLEEIETLEAKKRILAYIYEKYIVNGYYFHSFPSAYYEQVVKNGLDPYDYACNIKSLEEIKKLLEKHNGKNIIRKDLKDILFITLTDSLALAYHYALNAPSYLAELTATSSYMEKEKKYDRSAYLQKNFQHAEKNIEQLCRDLELSNMESTVVLESFVEEWKRLDITNSHPTVAFIKRKAIAKNYLKDYRNILESCEKEELSYSIGRIMESRVHDEKRYTPIAKENLKVISLPSYKEIYDNQESFLEETLEKEEIKEEMPERVNIRMEVVNTYGNASIVALLGILFITLGATITILLAVYKG